MPPALPLGRFKLDRHPQVIWALSAALGVETLALAWFGGRATIEWQRTTHLFVQSRVEQVSDRVVTTLRHDMTQATAALMTRLSPRYDLTSATALGDLIGPSFRDYPYIAVFFSWNAADGTMTLIGPANRTEPRWSAVTTFEVRDGQTSVVQYQRPLFATALLARARQFDAAYPTVFGTFAFVEDGTEYQAVVRLLHPNGQRPYTGVIGFLVDVARTKAEYLPETARRIARDLGESQFTFDFFRTDAPPPPPASGAFSDRTFPLRFQDASADVLEARVTFPVETWVVRTTAPADALLAMADEGARRSFVLVALFSVAILVSLLLSVHAVRRTAEASSVEAEFVSNVTHALKTPLTNIQLTAETLGRGRVAGPDAIRDYANILSAESARLTQLIENLLGFARVHRFGVDELVPCDLSDLTDDVLRRLQPRLDALGFAVSVDMPSSLTMIRADRRSLLHALDNVFDNAIKYSPTTRSLRIRGSESSQMACLQIADDGAGIPLVDQSRVFDKFYRGSNVEAGGSGLGLTIAANIVRAHGGDISVGPGSTSGTVVTIRLPTARES